MNELLSKTLRCLKHRSVQTLLILSIYILIAPYLPTPAHRALYTISLFIKELLVWIMPLTVGFFIAHTLHTFERRAPLFIIILIIFEGLSNFTSVWYTFACGNLVADSFPSIQISTLNHDFTVLWQFPLTRPIWWSAEKGTIVGLILGCTAAFTKGSPWGEVLQRGIAQGKEKAEWILTKVFSRLIPLFIVGFIAQVLQTHMLTHLFTHYAILIIYLALFLVGYLLFLFILGAGWSWRNIFQSINNLLPAGGIALTSSCSLSTMPWTIEGAAKNLKHPPLAKAIIPATTNIQQIGDCIANAFLCFLIYRHFYGQNPDMMMWLSFSTVFVLARFTTAAVLGGAIFIMLPIYESYLNFNAEMIAIILACNVILDPVITSSNVLANGALCRVFERVWSKALNYLSAERKKIIIEVPHK